MIINKSIYTDALFPSVVSPTLLLWPVLIELAFELEIVVLTEQRFIALEILNKIFKNSKNYNL